VARVLGLGEESSTVAMLLFGVLAVTLWPAIVLVHELGHAVVARWHGVPVEEVVATPEGRTVSVRIGGIPVRIGLGLKREYRSIEPAGWTKVGQREISDRAAIQIFLAGPIASGLFGVLMLAVRVLLPPPEPLPAIFVLGGLSSIIGSACNLLADADGQSDGARIRQIRRMKHAQPPEDPRAATSVPPPRQQWPH
jgi:membrane-associated protease RseP (regulator of RpoE activity)